MSTAIRLAESSQEPSDVNKFDVDQFMQHFGVMVGADGGAARVRDLILRLAVSGRLVQPDLSLAAQVLGPGQGDGVSAGRRARSSTLPLESLPVDQQPYTLPSNWVWARVNDTGEYINGLAFKPGDWGDRGYPIIRIQNLTDPSKSIHRSAGEFEPAYIVQTGDLLVSWSATLDVFIWDREPGVLNQHIFRVLPLAHRVLPRYLYYALRRSIREMAAGEHAHGLVMKHINRGPFLAHPFALPPLAEQKRIVAKVDQLMALCDELEARQTKKREIGKRTTKSAFEALTNAEDPEGFDAAWTRVVQNFDALIDHPEKVAELKRAVLRLAICGRLVRGRGVDWPRVPLAEVADARLGKMLDKVKNKGKPFPYLRNTNVHWFRLQLEDIKEMLFGEAELEEYELHAGDLLVCEGGHGIGRTAVWNGELAPMMFQKALHRLRPHPEMNSTFLAYQLKVAADTGVLERYFTGAGIPHLTGRRLAELEVVAPSRSLQDATVARVEQIIRTCDELEDLLQRSEDLAGRLTEAAAAELIAAGRLAYE